MNRAALAALFFALACGSNPVVPVGPASEDAIEQAGELDLIVIPRRTDGRVWLSLWIDAGTRDADPPTIATVTAWLAAEAGTTTASPVFGRVIPDGSELTMACERSELRGCLERLEAGLARRSVDEPALVSALERFRRGRSIAWSDPRRRADALAVSALLEHSVDPFDGSPPTRAQVVRFLRDHYGGDRALLIAIGDVERDAVQAAVAEVFLDAPSAEAERRDPRVGTGPTIQLDVGDPERSQTSVATLWPSVEEAQQVAQRWHARARAFGLSGAQAEVFPVRGGAVALVRSEGEPAEVAATLSRRVRELALETEHFARPDVRSGDDPRELARWLGARWSARGESVEAGSLAVGVLIAGGRGDSVREEDPDAALRQQTERAVERALREAGEEVSMDGDLDEDAADVRLPNGAVLRARRVSGAAELAIAMTFEGGACEEDAAVHGITAVLATTLAAMCDRVAAAELGQPLASLGAEVRAVLETERWGISLVGPRERWAALTYLAPRCVESLRLSRVEVAFEVSDAQNLETNRWLSEVAESLAPDRPGRIAPHGHDASRAAVDSASLRRWFRSNAVAPRLRVGLVGDVALTPALQRLARGCARFVEGAPPGAPRWDVPPVMLRAIHRDEGIEVAIGWMAADASNAPTVGRAFAEAARRSLALEPGVTPSGAAGGAFGGRTWAAVSARVSPDALEQISTRIERALSEVDWDTVAETAHRRGSDARAWRMATPRAGSVSLADERANRDLPSQPAMRSALAELARATPVYVIARPQPGQR